LERTQSELRASQREVDVLRLYAEMDPWSIADICDEADKVPELERLVKELEESVDELTAELQEANDTIIELKRDIESKDNELFELYREDERMHTDAAPY